MVKGLSDSTSFNIFKIQVSQFNEVWKWLEFFFCGVSKRHLIREVKGELSPLSWFLLKVFTTFTSVNDLEKARTLYNGNFQINLTILWMIQKSLFRAKKKTKKNLAILAPSTFVPFLLSSDSDGILDPSERYQSYKLYLCNIYPYSVKSDYFKTWYSDRKKSWAPDCEMPYCEIVSLL